MKVEGAGLNIPIERREPAATAESPKPTILIVEDEAGPREALKIILRPFFNLYSVDNPEVAMQVLREQKIDLVTLDLKLPGRQGTELLQEIKAEQEDVEVVIITGYGSLKTAMEGIRYGAAAYLLKPFNVTELIEVINQTLEKKRRLDSLRDTLRTIGRLWGTELDSSTVWRNLSKLLEAKNPELVRHSSRVNFYATLLAEHLNLSAAEREILQIGSFLHDIGKVSIDNRILSKPAKLDSQADEQVKRHPEIGARMVLALPFPPEVAEIIHHHHEHYDGSGFPNGLQGENIPCLARIVCLANVFDHLLTDRHADGHLTMEEAREYVRVHAGTLFDPKLAELFVQVVR
jgi:putative nucleotidyltransferase with HDIG domain